MNPLDHRWTMVRDRWPLRVKNSSGSAITPYSIVLVTSETTSNNEALYTVVKPNAAATDFNRSKYLVTGPFAIGSSGSDEGLATNLTQPNYISTDAAASVGQIWGPKHNQFTASRYYYGYEILGGATTFNGVNIAVAKWIGVDTVLGKADAAITSGNSGTISIWNGAGGAEADTSMNITGVYNRATSDVASGDWVYVFWNGDSPYIFPGSGTTSGAVLYRGVTDTAVAKGGTVTVSRYNPGTNTDSGTNDTGVVSELSAVVSGAKVYYMDNGASKYIIAVEKTEVPVMGEIRIKSGYGKIEAKIGTAQIEMTVAQAWTDQITLLTKTVLEDMRIKSGNAYIEAQAVDILVLQGAVSEGWSDKIPLTTCT